MPSNSCSIPPQPARADPRPPRKTRCKVMSPGRISSIRKIHALMHDIPDSPLNCDRYTASAPNTRCAHAFSLWERYVTPARTGTASVFAVHPGVYLFPGPAQSRHQDRAPHTIDRHRQALPALRIPRLRNSPQISQVWLRQQNVSAAYGFGTHQIGLLPQYGSHC